MSIFQRTDNSNRVLSWRTVLCRIRKHPGRILVSFYSRVKFFSYRCLLSLSDREPANPPRISYDLICCRARGTGGPDLNRKSIKFSCTVPTFSSSVAKTRLTAIASNRTTNTHTQKKRGGLYPSLEPLLNCTPNKKSRFLRGDLLARFPVSLEKLARQKKLTTLTVSNAR